MSGRSPRETSLRRWRSVWRKHNRGMTNAEIAAKMGISPRLVRYYLAKGEHPEITSGRQARGTTGGTRPGIVPPVVPSPGGNVVPLRKRA